VVCRTALIRAGRALSVASRPPQRIALALGAGTAVRVGLRAAGAATATRHCGGAARIVRRDGTARSGGTAARVAACLVARHCRGLAALVVQPHVASGRRTAVRVGGGRDELGRRAALEVIGASLRENNPSDSTRVCATRRRAAVRVGAAGWCRGWERAGPHAPLQETKQDLKEKRHIVSTRRSRKQHTDERSTLRKPHAKSERIPIAWRRHDPHTGWPTPSTKNTTANTQQCQRGGGASEYTTRSADQLQRANVRNVATSF
jgi:uncharacterized protein YndB with AHSA1/START domain